MRDLFGASVYKLLGNPDTSWLCSNNTVPEDGIPKEATPEQKEQWRRKTRENAAKSKTGQWGPTHSFSSDDESGFAEEKKMEIDVPVMVTPERSKATSNGSQEGTASTKCSPDSSQRGVAPDHHEEEKKEVDPLADDTDDVPDEPMEAIPCTLGRVWNNLQCLEDRTLPAVDEKQPQEIQPTAASTAMNQSSRIFDMFDEMCSPCKPKNLQEEFSFECDEDDAPLGISRLAPPNACMPSFSRSRRNSTSNSRSVLSRPDDRSAMTNETPAERRRSRARRRGTDVSKSKSGGPANDTSTTQEAYEVTPEQVVLVRKDEKDPKSPVSSKNRPLPVEQLELNSQTAVELERCISELTMRSSYGEATAKIAENRRMAYYAVGKHHRQSGRGGNRRCYFTGKLILGGAPFYAGSVQQGLRTLVVFCLPSAVGLPLEMQPNSSHSDGRSIGSRRRPSLSNRSQASASVAHSRGGPRSTAGSLLSRKGSKLSRLSSVDDTSVEEELDPNWELDKEYLLSVLPEPTQDLLDEMALRYPAQFETLPVQVRSPHCWKLYVKFCFFSGLPIAEGEMHYKVRDHLANQYGEEIILSHEVMEAVNGDSSELLRLPNLKTFRYLRKHYHQQSAKLPNSCFERQAWEMVRPEV
ncbi:MAG: hypothetical protein SGILL_005356 [Bacillariaceae sp.]